jgi:acetyl-CoA acetyltransferase
MSAVIIGVGEAPYTRHPPEGTTTMTFLRDAMTNALRDAGLGPRDIDGLAVTSFSLSPDSAIDLAWRMGLSVRWLMQDTNGGASGHNMLGHAIRGIEAGAASTILIVSGDSLGQQGGARLSAVYNSAVRDHLTPIGHGGPNALFAMMTQRQMKVYGLSKEDYGHIAIAQRSWAAGNPSAVYRQPLTMEAYLAAPLVSDPLCTFDCVPTVSGANAIVVSTADRCPFDRVPVRVRALRQIFNYDNQLGDGLRTGLSRIADDFWKAAAIGPEDVDLACFYDDFPSIVIAQLNDLGFIPDGDMRRFISEKIATRHLPVNTSGGLLSAGQAGAAGGLHGLVEAIRQLQHRAGERQIPNAKFAVTSGYGMVLYRYAANSAAAILERCA